MDKILVVDVEGEDAPLSLHVEVEAVWQAKVPRKTFRYWSLAHRAHDDLWSLVICLKPGARQGEPKAFYERAVRGQRAVRFDFDVVQVWQLDAEELLRGARPGLLPLIPYARGATRAHAELALEALARIEPERRRGELQSALVAFAENVFPDVDWGARMPEELLMGSTIYQRGEVSGQRKSVIRLLAKRFGATGESLVTSVRNVPEGVLDQVVDLFGERLADDALFEKLGRLLLPTDEASDAGGPS